MNTQNNYSDNCNKLFQYWRFRTLYSIMFGFTFYYILRNNFSFFIKIAPDQFSCSKDDLSKILSYGVIIYGTCKFLCGMLVDRFSARYILSCGLLMSGITNILIGLAPSIASTPKHAIILIVVFYYINQLFQSAGAPPCTKLLTHWFSSRERGSRWALWSSCQNIGSAIIFLLAAPIIHMFGWTYLFFIPGVFAILASFFVFSRLRDTPESLDLPSIEQYDGTCVANSATNNTDGMKNDHQIGIIKILYTALNNKMVWLIAASNFCLYFCKNFFEKFGALFLHDYLKFKDGAISAAMTSVEIAGIFGGMFAGVVSDRFFKGNRAQVSIFYFAMIFVTLLIFSAQNESSNLIIFVAMFMIGFFLFGSQVLTGVFSTDISDKRVSATANAFVGILGNLGAAIGLRICGFYSTHYGWHSVFKALLYVAFCGVMCFVATYYLNKRNKTVP